MTRSSTQIRLEPLAVRSPQAAAILGISEKTLIEWSKSDDPPPCIRRGGCILYPIADLQIWLSRQLNSRDGQLSQAE